MAYIAPSDVAAFDACARTLTVFKLSAPDELVRKLSEATGRAIGAQCFGAAVHSCHNQIEALFCRLRNAQVQFGSTEHPLTRSFTIRGSEVRNPDDVLVPWHAVYVDRRGQVLWNEMKKNQTTLDWDVYVPAPEGDLVADTATARLFNETYGSPAAMASRQAMFVPWFLAQTSAEVNVAAREALEAIDQLEADDVDFDGAIRREQITVELIHPRCRDLDHAPLRL